MIAVQVVARYGSKPHSANRPATLDAIAYFVSCYWHAPAAGEARVSARDAQYAARALGVINCPGIRKLCPTISTKVLLRPVGLTGDFLFRAGLVESVSHGRNNYHSTLEDVSCRSFNRNEG